jgi:hypothetical protein
MVASDDTFVGGCACGAVRYRSTGDVLFALNCHCRDCQRETGSGYAPVLGVARAGFALTRGTTRAWDVTADSGTVTRRHFCADCGSPLYGEPLGHPDMITLRAGSLDDPSVFRPSRDIYTARAQHWDHMNPALPKTKLLD